MLLLMHVSIPMKTHLDPHRSTRPGAIRMARLRDRRQRGYQCYLVEICDADLDKLIRRCLLDRMRRDDPAAIQEAIGALLDGL
jgi:hypothetical protein